MGQFKSSEFCWVSESNSSWSTFCDCCVTQMMISLREVFLNPFLMWSNSLASFVRAENATVQGFDYSRSTSHFHLVTLNFANVANKANEVLDSEDLVLHVYTYYVLLSLLCTSALKWTWNHQMWLSTSKSWVYCISLFHSAIWTAKPLYFNQMAINVMLEKTCKMIFRGFAKTSPEFFFFYLQPP